MLKAGLEAVDQNARRPEAGQLHDRRWSKLDERPERHPLKVQTGSGDILAQVPRCDLVTAIGGNCDHGGLHREAVPLLHQAARANERRFWRR
ncbi:hypothetical protein ABIB10_003405 [Bradyrhizobium sp. RT3b]